jgi:hypothetical protein
MGVNSWVGRQSKNDGLTPLEKLATSIPTERIYSPNSCSFGNKLGTTSCLQVRDDLLSLDKTSAAIRFLGLYLTVGTDHGVVHPKR